MSATGTLCRKSGRSDPQTTSGGRYQPRSLAPHPAAPREALAGTSIPTQRTTPSRTTKPTATHVHGVMRSITPLKGEKRTQAYGDPRHVVMRSITPLNSA